MKLVMGWGINDLDRSVQNKIRINGKQVQTWTCPYYSKWQCLINRVHKTEDKNLSYKDCTICEEWKYLSNFIDWVDSQPNRDWKNCELDKDLLLAGNKHYSPESCVFITKQVNGFIRDTHKVGKYMRGVRKNRHGGFIASIGDFSEKGKRLHIGVYTTEMDAHSAWKAKKHEYALKLAELQADIRVAEALCRRYSI